MSHTRQQGIRQSWLEIIKSKMGPSATQVSRSSNEEMKSTLPTSKRDQKAHVTDQIPYFPPVNYLVWMLTRAVSKNPVISFGNDDTNSRQITKEVENYDPQKEKRKLEATSKRLSNLRRCRWGATKQLSDEAKSTTSTSWSREVQTDTRRIPRQELDTRSKSKTVMQGQASPLEQLSESYSTERLPRWWAWPLGPKGLKTELIKTMPKFTIRERSNNEET